LRGPLTGRAPHVAAFEAADVGGLMRLLTEEAVVEPKGISRLTMFRDPELFAIFGLPRTLG
jgi:hypothetical protein